MSSSMTSVGMCMRYALCMDRQGDAPWCEPHSHTAETEW